MKTEYTFAEYIPAVARKGSGFAPTGDGKAETSRNVQRCAVAPHSNAMTGSRDNDTSVQSQAERDKTVAANEGGSERSSVGVKLP